MIDKILLNEEYCSLCRKSLMAKEFEYNSTMKNICRNLDFKLKVLCAHCLLNNDAITDRKNLLNR